MSNEDIFDGLLMNIVQKSEGIDNFYDAVFGFMRRKTDFFSVPEKARTTVLDSFAKHAQLFKEDKDRQELIKRKQEEKRQKEEEQLKAQQKQAETKPAQPAPEPESKVEEITDEEAERLLAQEMGTSDDKKVEPTPDVSEEKPEGEGDEKDDGTPPLIGNGLRTDKYAFTQTLSDITINVFVPQGIKGKDLNVVVQQKHLKVQVKGQTPIIDGELPEKVNSEETIWTLDTVDGERV